MTKWQPIESAPMNQPVLVTDGTSVWFGNFEESSFQNGHFFSGANLQTGEMTVLSPHACCELTGWQPAPATMWRPQPIPYDRLIQIAIHMHCWIFLNTCDEEKAYRELGLTEEEDKILGYGGGFEVGGEENETD